MTRAQAITALLSLPDEPCMPRRAHDVTQLGSNNPEIIKRDLGTAYVTWRRHDHASGDISCVVSVCRQPLYALRKQA